MLVKGVEISRVSRCAGLCSEKPGVACAAMVGDDIQHQTHIALVDSLPQCYKRLFPAKVRVYLFIIGYVILMVTGRCKNRGEVEGRDPKVHKVIQPLLNALEITAEKLTAARFSMGSRAFSPGAGNHRLSVTVILPCAHIIGGIAIVETIREDLVKDALLHPVRCVVIGQDFEIAGISWSMACNAAIEIPVSTIRSQEKKAVVGTRHAKFQLKLPPARDSTGAISGSKAHLLHVLLSVGSRAEKYALDGSLPVDAQTQCYS